MDTVDTVTVSDLNVCNNVTLPFLGAFAKLRKASVTFIMSGRPSASLNGTTRLPLDGFLWNFIFQFFQNLSKELKFHSTLTKITGTLLEHQYTFWIISRSFLLRMRNVSCKSCRGTQNTHFIFSYFFLRISCRLWGKVGKNIVEPERP